jgi:hypothetical protein
MFHKKIITLIIILFDYYSGSYFFYIKLDFKIESALMLSTVNPFLVLYHSPYNVVNQ